MKSLATATTSETGVSQRAEVIMDTVSMVTRAIKREVRRHRPMEIPMEQYRALRVVHRHPGASLLVVAGHLGITTASACKLVDALVKQQLVTRQESTEDRRKVVLNVTQAGEDALEAAQKAALGHLSEILSQLSESDQSILMRAMEILNRALPEEQA